MCRYTYIGGQPFPTACAGSNLGGNAKGAAIWVSGKLDLRSTTVSTSLAEPGWGGSTVTVTGVPPYQLPVIVPLPPGETGAALQVEGDSPLYLEATVLRDNAQRSVAAGGSVRSLNSEFADNGDGMSAASLELDRSTVANNRGPINTGAAVLVNTTLTGNKGGINATSVTLDYATLADNSQFNLQTQRLTAHRSLVIASAEAPACSTASVAIDASSYNWFSDTTCGLTSATDRQSPGDFRLQPLADNGGPVPTQLPGAGSALIDVIPPSLCERTTDARGTTRPQANGCDIGAAEATP